MADYYEKKARVRISKGYLFDVTSREENDALVAELREKGLNI